MTQPWDQTSSLGTRHQPGLPQKAITGMMLHTWPVQVIMAFVDNWVEGVDQYVGWAGLSDQVSFFTDPKVMQLYKNNVQVLTSRVNTINGRKYSEDPTIFAWDLINEPRCNSDCPAGTISVSTGCSDQII